MVRVRKEDWERHNATIFCDAIGIRRSLMSRPPTDPLDFSLIVAGQRIGLELTHYRSIRDKKTFSSAMGAATAKDALYGALAAAHEVDSSHPFKAITIDLLSDHGKGPAPPTKIHANLIAEIISVTKKFAADRKAFGNLTWISRTFLDNGQYRLLHQYMWTIAECEIGFRMKTSWAGCEELIPIPIDVIGEKDHKVKSAGYLSPQAFRSHWLLIHEGFASSASKEYLYCQCTKSSN